MSKRKQPSIASAFAKFPCTGSAKAQLPDIAPITIEDNQAQQGEPTVSELFHTGYDIAQFINCTSLSDSQCHEVLTNRFTPARGWQGPLREIGKKNRRAPAFIFARVKYPSLSYIGCCVLC